MHQYSDVAWSSIHAAWVCDDEDNYEASKMCRENAIPMIEKAVSLSQKIIDQAGATEAITIDLMRRAGLFQQALSLVEKTKSNEAEEIITRIINYEEKLIVLEDVDLHTVSEDVIKE